MSIIPFIQLSLTNPIPNFPAETDGSIPIRTSCHPACACPLLLKDYPLFSRKESRTVGVFCEGN